MKDSRCVSRRINPNLMLKADLSGPCLNVRNCLKFCSCEELLLSFTCILQLVFNIAGILQIAVPSSLHPGFDPDV